MLGLTPNTPYRYHTRASRGGEPIGEIAGTATARHEQPSPGTARLLLAETGAWTVGPHRGLAVTNAWFAERTEPNREHPPTIDIHQARGRAPGDAASAYLLTLRGGPHRWTTLSPHPCAQDTYTLTVRARPGGLVVLDWTVSGPAKNDRLVTTYTPAVTPSPRP